MFNSSIQVESRCSTQVLESSQNVNMKTQLDDQSISNAQMRVRCKPFMILTLNLLIDQVHTV